MPMTPALMDLTGRTALVTGAASGIGASCVERLAAAGARVHAVDRDKEGLERFASMTGVQTLPTDLSDLAAVDELPADVDILVNNAGIQHVSPIHEFPVETWDLIIRLMLTSPFRLTRRVLPHMYAQGFGRIVNVSSVHGLRASAYKAAYVSAKHGLEGLSKVTALEGAEHGVTSNCVNPAYVRTPLVEKQIADQATSPRHQRGRGGRQDHARAGRRQAARRGRRGGRARGLPVRPVSRLGVGLVVRDGRRLDRPLMATAT